MASSPPFPGPSSPANDARGLRCTSPRCSSIRLPPEISHTGSADLTVCPPPEWRSDETAAISSSLEDTPVNLRILRSTAEFEELRSYWSAWTGCPEADLDLFSIHLRHTPGVVRPHVLVVYRNGCPDCLLVGWLHDGPLDFKVGSFPLFRPRARVLRFVNGGFLGGQSRRNSELLLREILRSLQEHDAEAAEFSQLRVDSPLYCLAKREPNVFCRDHFTPVHTHRYLTLPANFDEFLRGLSGKSRHQFRRNARMLERDFPGKVRFQWARSERDVEEFARASDAISRRTYKGALGMGFVDNLEMRETLRAAAQKAALRACVLYIGERPVAFASGIVSREVLYGTFTAYDPEFKKYRPGLQALLRLVEESLEPRGSVSRIDAGCGESPYKRALFHSSWNESPVWIFAPSVKGLSLNLRKLVAMLLHSLAMRLFTKSRYLRKIKKMCQRRALRDFQCKVSPTHRR